MKSEEFLVHYSEKLPVVLATDASPVGVGAVLSHIMLEGTENPIQFASQTLIESHCKWAQIDKEAYSIVFGVKKLNSTNFYLVVSLYSIRITNRWSKYFHRQKLFRTCLQQGRSIIQYFYRCSIIKLNTNVAVRTQTLMLSQGYQ